MQIPLLHSSLRRCFANCLQIWDIGNWLPEKQVCSGSMQCMYTLSEGHLRLPSHTAHTVRTSIIELQYFVHQYVYGKFRQTIWVKWFRISSYSKLLYFMFKWTTSQKYKICIFLYSSVFFVLNNWLKRGLSWHLYCISTTSSTWWIMSDIEPLTSATLFRLQTQDCGPGRVCRTEPSQCRYRNNCPHVAVCVERGKQEKRTHSHLSMIYQLHKSLLPVVS